MKSDVQETQIRWNVNSSQQKVSQTVRCVWDNCFSIDGSIRSTCHEVTDLLRPRKRERKREMKINGKKGDGYFIISSSLLVLHLEERERRRKKEVNSIDAHAPFRGLFKSRSRWGMSNCWIIGNSCSRGNSKIDFGRM